MDPNDPNQSQQVTPDLAQQIASAIKGALPQAAPAPQQQQPLSEEQMAQIFKRFVPGDDLLELMFGQDATPQNRGKALRDLVAGVVQEAVATAGVYQQLAMQQLREEWSPSLEAAQEMQRQRMFEEFYGDFPVLKEHDAVVKAILPTIAQAKDLPTDRKEVFKRIATESEKLLKTAKPDFALTPANPQAGGNPQVGGSPTPASLGGGGRGGAPTGDPKSQQSLATSIFD